MGTQLSAGSLNVVSGRDTTLQGATVVADGNIAMLAARDLTIESAQNDRLGVGSAADSRSGFTGSWSQPGVGHVKNFGVNASASTWQTPSQVASLAGNVTLVAGNEYRQTASSVLAAGQAGELAGGDVNVLAKKVTINEAFNTERTVGVQRSGSTQLGGSASVGAFGVSVSTNDLKKGNGTGTLGQLRNSASAISETSSNRAKALGAVNLAVTGKQLYDGVSQLASDAAAGPTLTYGVSVSLSRNESQGASFSSSSQAVGSSVVGAGNVNIVATGGGEASNIHASGSTIAAGDTVKLYADNDILLEASQSATTSASRNASHGASVGVTLGAGAQTGLSFQVGVQSGKGRDNQNSVTHTPTVVTGGKAANITSGGDLSLNGAVVEAEQVKAKVGGDLKITTLQDVSTGQSDQSSSGFGLSVCIPPICGGAIVLPSASAAGASAGGSYVSPTTQAGIKAGDGGFDVDVAGNTTLVGGVIESTQAAVDAKKNSFVTGGTLTMTDLQNSNSSEGEGYSVSATVPIGYGTKPVEGVEPTPEQQAAGVKGTPAQPSGFYWTPPKDANGNSVANNTPTGSAGVGSHESSQTSVTKAGISGIAGDKSVRTGDLTSAGTLVKDWDTQAIIKDVQAQVQITQQFGQNASKAVGDYAKGKLKEADALYDAAAAESDLDKKAALYAQADELRGNWKEGGAYRIAAHVAVGGLTGGAGGAAGAAASSIAIPAIAQQIATLDVPEPVKQALVMATGAAIGAATGGSAGAASAFNETTNNFLTAADLRSRDQKIKACQAKGDPACEVRVLQEYDRRSADNTGEFKGSSLLEKMSLENVRSGLEHLLLDPNVSEETKGQARRSIQEINTAINVIDKAPVLKDAAELGLLTVDIATLGEFAAARALSTTIVKEYVLRATGKKIADDIAARVTNNFYRDGIDATSWTVGKVGDMTGNALGHWKKHGHEFPEFNSFAQYTEAAQNFVVNPPSGALTKTAKNGDVLLYDLPTNTFAVRTADGVPKTMYRPSPEIHGFPTNMDFWNSK